MVESVENLPCFKDLIAVLFECFLIISLGYLSCRFKLISAAATDLNSYLTTFALPMVVFLNISQMEFQTINLSFLLCMLIAKLLLFISVTIITLTISSPTNFAYAGALSILATQSNDFALGYPLIKSLYGDTKPEMLTYLSLMAPIQLLILNPLGIVMLEYQKSVKQKTLTRYDNLIPSNHHQLESHATPVTILGNKSPLKINTSFLKALATNPLIFASIVALLVNLTYGPELPRYVTKVSNTIAASFAAPALFVVGLSIYGKFELIFKNPNDLLLSSILVLTKVLLLPNFMRMLAVIILPNYTPVTEISYLTDFSFLYGLLPTAPTACIIAKQYGVLPNVVSISMLLSIFMSAPLMLTASAMISPSVLIKMSDLELIMAQIMKFSSLSTLTFGALTLYTIWKSRRKISYSNFIIAPQVVGRRINYFKTNPTHLFIFLLTISQIFIGIGGVLWYCVESHKQVHFDSPSGLSSPVVNHSTTNDLPERNQLSELLIDNGVHSIISPDTLSLALTLPIERPEAHSGRSSEEAQQVKSEALPLITESKSISNDFILITNNLNISFKSSFGFHYVFSSIGMMMSQFVILALLVIIAAARFKGQTIAYRMSSIMFQMFLLVSGILIVWLVVDSNNQTRIPIESILPNAHSSVYVRLVYNAILLALTLPLFVSIVKSDNERKQKLEKSNSNEYTTESHVETVITSSIMKRRFLTSSASLSSDTSSALTTNTTLESSNCQFHQLDANNNNPNSQVAPDGLSIVLDCKGLNSTSVKRSVTPYEIQAISNSQAHPYPSYDNAILDTQRVEQNITTDAGLIGTDHYEVDDGPSLRNNDNNANESVHVLQRTELNKCYILIVFLLICSTLNLTSLAQKSIQGQASGTFRQIEMMNVLMVFSQGLLTFMLYGIKGFVS